MSSWKSSYIWHLAMESILELVQSVGKIIKSIKIYKNLKIQLYMGIGDGNGFEIGQSEK